MSNSTTVILTAYKDDAVACAVGASIAGDQARVDLQLIDPSELIGMELADDVVLVIGDTSLNLIERSDLSECMPGFVQFLGCRPLIGLVSKLQGDYSTVAGISPVIAPRVAKRVTGFSSVFTVRDQVESPVWGLVGLGFTGSVVARNLVDAGSRVTVADVRTPRSGLLTDLGVKRLTLDLLLTGADVVSLHIQQGPTASPLVGPRELTLMKSGATLINTSHSSIVDESAVIDALQAGRLGGYATDCPGDAVAEASQSLATSGKLVVTTNALTNQIGASQQIAQFVNDNIKLYIDGRNISGAIELVDFPNTGDPSFWTSRMSPRQD
jgi:hypothetical protein